MSAPAVAGSEIRRYEADGYLILGRLFDADEVALLKAEAARIGSPGRALGEANLVDPEKGHIWRSYAMDLDSEVFFTLTRLPRLLDRARTLIGARVYLWQSHMNHKPAGKGEAWEWHQDYANWHLDGMPRGGPRDVVTFMVMLDDCTDANGPLKLIPGSHRDGRDEGYRDSESGFEQQVITPAKLEALTAANGIVELQGPAGTVVMFTGLTMHGSAENLSGAPRCLAYVVYNREDNRPTLGPGESRRPHVSPYQIDLSKPEIAERFDDGALARLASTR